MKNLMNKMLAAAFALTSSAVFAAGDCSIPGMAGCTVPEPDSLLLVGLGLAAAVAVGKFMKNRRK